MLLQPSDPISFATVAAAGVAAAVVDLRTRRVPNALVASVASAGFGLSAMHYGAGSVSMAGIGCLVAFGCMLPGHLLGGTGAGDVKLFAAMGTVLGPGTIVVAFLYTAIAGGFLALIVALTRSSLGSTVSRTAALVATGGANLFDLERPTVLSAGLSAEASAQAEAFAKADNRFAYAPAIAIGVLAAALTVR